MDAENVVHRHKGYNSAIKMTPCRFSSLDELESPEERKPGRELAAVAECSLNEAKMFVRPLFNYV